MTTNSTFWETSGRSRWSKYLANIEENVLDRTLKRFDRPGRAIEIGCDGGKWSSKLMSLGWEITCVDIDPATLDLCKKRLPDARTVLADPHATSYDIDDEFDLLLAIQVPPAEHEWFALESARLLRTGGMMVFDVINSASYRSWLSLVRSKARKDKVFYTSRFNDVRKAYQSAGFSFLETVGHAWAPFSRDSNSKLIPVATSLEQMLGLRRFSAHAPWVISVVQNSKTKHETRDDRHVQDSHSRLGVASCES